MVPSAPTQSEKVATTLLPRLCRLYRSEIEAQRQKDIDTEKHRGRETGT